MDIGERAIAGFEIIAICTVSASHAGVEQGTCETAANVLAQQRMANETSHDREGSYFR